MKIIRLSGVIETTGLARSTIYNLTSEGGFPRPVPLVGRSVGWLESEIQDWIKGRLQREILTHADNLMPARSMTSRRYLSTSCNSVVDCLPSS
ncbi:AlpA family phage regulatory protein [Pseudomonas stutzeri]|uniref:AlpA family transcriptional regulator n=2 Tax=Stutzerimonas stutzeri TaxID=316 RepID=M2VP38_STUST|nr:AlpA family transcriptional regulator [Stutzerimonas stutzeri]EME01768.1 AlpA family transcriptional regulator [Stutzerimonas stutzeri NF13]MBK3880958.1 AlpA family phage regulatory protein [Stutzerimonas stutzeri]